VQSGHISKLTTSALAELDLKPATLPDQPGKRSGQSSTPRTVKHWKTSAPQKKRNGGPNSESVQPTVRWSWPERPTAQSSTQAVRPAPRRRPTGGLTNDYR